jgi:hypothetical protein
MALTVLSMDPGTTNFAASVLRVAPSGDVLKTKVIGSRLISNTIKVPGDLQREARAFRSEVFSLEHMYGPFDLVVAERFQSRGLKGTTIESINMMLGVLAVMYDSLTVYTAATWKNAFNRKFDLKDLYEVQKISNKPIKKSERRTIHELDCTLMGVFHACKQLGYDPFHQFEGEDKLLKFFRHFDSSLRV